MSDVGYWFTLSNIFHSGNGDPLWLILHQTGVTKVEHLVWSDLDWTVV